MCRHGIQEPGQTLLKFRHGTQSTAWASAPRQQSEAATALLRYPFIQLGVRRMTGITKKSNKKARNLMGKLGFVLEGVHPFAAGGSTACTYGLYEKTAKEKWLKHG